MVKKTGSVCHTEGGHFEHLLSRCLPNIQVAIHHKRLFSEPATFGGKQHTFNQMNKFCISHGNVVTFFRCGEQVHSNGCSSFYCKITQIQCILYVLPGNQWICNLSWALQSWKSGHFQQLSPLPFTMGAGNWPRILKL